jgi:drug/metabolite transporter (DMT)-like permease
LRWPALLLWIRSLIGAVSVLCLAWNLQHTSVGFANTLFNLAPIVVVILGAYSGHEKLETVRLISILLVVLASVLFWHGSRSEANVVIWLVGLGGMGAAAIAYTLLKSLPSSWSPFDIAWCLSIATLPVALLFKHGQWAAPVGNVRWTVTAICILSLVGYRHSCLPRSSGEFSLISKSTTTPLPRVLSAASCTWVQSFA